MLLSLFFGGHVYSQDLKAAYISANHIVGTNFTYSITVTLLTESSLNISRPTVTLSFGDATTGTFSASSTSGNAGTTIKIYTGTHQYSGAGIYVVSLLDTFRVAGIKTCRTHRCSQSMWLHK